jgi:hypothetical protein
MSAKVQAADNSLGDLNAILGELVEDSPPPLSEDEVQFTVQSVNTGVGDTQASLVTGFTMPYPGSRFTLYWLH